MERTTLKIIVMVFLFASCNWDSNNKIRGFYDYSRISDLYRIPIIEPYEIISSDRGFSWFMDFKGNNPPSRLGTGKIDSVGVKGKYVMLYSNRTALPAIGMTEAWFIINATINEEIFFTDESKCKSYLQKQGINQIELYDINAVFKDFEEKSKLPNEWPGQPSQK